ncbi:unnamed protein product, partial [Coregonus sp. 'balchen']
GKVAEVAGRSKDVLCNENSRINYDVLKISKNTKPFHGWLALGNSVKTEPMLVGSKATFPDSFQDRDCTDHKSPERPSPDAALS